MEDNLAALDQVTRSTIDLGMKFGPRLLVAVAIIVAGYFAAGWLARAVGHALRRFELEPPVQQLILNVARVLVLVLFGLMALENLGVDLLPLVAGLGVAGAGVALAMQGVLGNVAAGLTIIMTRPFRVGEYISIAKEEGEVAEIRLTTTTLSHPDRSQVVIPNRRIVGEVLHNYGQIRQVQAEVSVAYDTDLDKAFAAVQEVLRANARVLKDPEPVLRITELGGSGVTISVLPWTHVPDYGAAGGEIKRALLETFRSRGIAIPFPQREVRLLGKAA